MKRKLSSQLSVGFIFIVLATVSLISISANLLIHEQFEKYMASQQKSVSEDMADALAPHYDAVTGQWNHDYIYGFGMYALQEGYFLKLCDTDGNTVWDAENHDMTLCHSMMQEISSRMEAKQPALEGEFVTCRYELKQTGSTVGYLDVSYYSPYYFSENDFRFLDALNRIILVVSVISVIGAIFAGIILAKGLLVPISKAIEITKDISAGNYEIRFEANVRTQELAELKDAVNQMADSLQRQEQLRSRLTSDIAHELRTPIANVTSQLEAILEGVWDATVPRLQSCYDELWRISALITDLEGLQQIECGNLQLHPESVDILELTHHTVASFEPELRRMQLNCTVSGESVLISGDSRRLQQVFANLLSNAIKYTPRQRNIDVHISRKDHQLIWSITDEGIGIPEADLPYIFERFYRTDRSRNRRTGGTGIGLTIVKAIVRAHGGQITVASGNQTGTNFTVYLPLP